MGSRNHVLDGYTSLYRTNPFAAARGDKTSTQPFAKIVWTLVVNSYCHKHFCDVDDKDDDDNDDGKKIIVIIIKV